MEKSVLELQKLQAELEKALLEVRKLQAEVAELPLKSRMSRSSMRLELWKVLPLYITIAVSIAGGTFSWFQQRQESLEQQAREQRLRVSKELIELVRQINQPSESLQRNAAVEIGFFGPVAAPILVENLGVDRNHPVTDAILNSLRRVVREEKDPQRHTDMAKAVVDVAETAVRRELAASRTRVNVLLANVGALDIVTKHPPVPPDVLGSVRQLLLEIRTRIAAPGGLDEEDRKQVEKHIEPLLAVLGV